MSITAWKLMIFWWGINAAGHVTANTFNGWDNPWPVVIYTALFASYLMAYYKRKLDGKIK